MEKKHHIREVRSPASKSPGTATAFTDRLYYTRSKKQTEPVDMVLPLQTYILDINPFSCPVREKPIRKYLAFHQILPLKS